MDIVWSVLQSLHFNAVAFQFQIVLFVLFHFSMKAIIYEPLMRTRTDREAQIEARLKEALKLADKAKMLKAEYESGMRKTREEFRGTLERSIADAEAEALQRRTLAREQAGNIIDEAQVQLEAEQKALRAQMGQQVDKLARSIATNVVTQNFSVGTQEKLLAKIGG